MTDHGDPRHYGGPSKDRIRVIKALTHRDTLGRLLYLERPGGPQRRLMSADDYARLNRAIDNECKWVLW